MQRIPRPLSHLSIAASPPPRPRPRPDQPAMPRRNRPRPDKSATPMAEEAGLLHDSKTIAATVTETFSLTSKYHFELSDALLVETQVYTAHPAQRRFG